MLADLPQYQYYQMEWIFESFSSCFGGLQLNYLQSLLAETLSWRDSGTVRIGERHFAVLKQVLQICKQLAQGEVKQPALLAASLCDGVVLYSVKFASLCHEVVGLVSTLASSLTLQALSAMVNPLSLQMHLQIGEGGYSFVYCVREVGTRHQYALKKVLSAQLTAALSLRIFCSNK